MRRLSFRLASAEWNRCFWKRRDFSKVYHLLVNKAERKGRTRQEVDEVIRWLTGYSQVELEGMLERPVSYMQRLDNTNQCKYLYLTGRRACIVVYYYPVGRWSSALQSWPGVQKGRRHSPTK